MESESTDLYNLFIFDSNVPPVEGAKIDIIYYYPPCKTAEDNNKRDIEAGLASAFIFFCKHFKPSEPCDYVFSGKKEISLLDLGKGIILCCSIHSTTSTKRRLLHQILSTIKDILYLTIGPMNIVDGKIQEGWITLLQNVMPHIIEVINWRDSVFDYLLDAFLPSTSHFKLASDDTSINIDAVLARFPMVQSIIFAWRNKIIFYENCDPSVAKLLTLLVFNKFKTYFPFKIKKREDVMRWTVGFTKSSKGVEIYTPPVFIKDKISALAVLQLNKIRVIILLDPRKTTDINDLQKFSKAVNTIALKLDRAESRHFEKDNCFGASVGVKLTHLVDSHRLIISNNKVEAYDYGVIEKGILLSHEFAHIIGQNATGLIPLKNSFHAFFNCDKHKDKYTVMQFKPKNTSEALEHIEDITNME